MQKLNLCIAAPSFYPTYGGAQLRFLRYLPGLRARFINVQIVTGTPTANEHTEPGHAEEWLRNDVGTILESETPDGTPVHRVRLPDQKGWRRSFLFNQTVLRFCAQPTFRADVLQLVTGLRPLTIPWLRRLHSRGVAVTYAVTIWPRSRSPKVHKRIFRAWSERLLYNQLDCVITNNSPLRETIGELGANTPVEVIPNGVDLKRFRPLLHEEERRDIRQHLGLTGEGPLVSTIGAVIPRKGCELLLEAWLRVVERFPSAQLLVIGPRTDLEDPKLGAFRERLSALRKATGAPENVHFTGEVPDVEVYLRASDLFVLPSRREGMPNSVLEAMASAVPVILTPFAGLSDDLGRPGEHFLLSSYDVGDLSEAIVSALARPKQCAALGNVGHQWIESRMGLDVALDRYSDVYRRLAAQRRPPMRGRAR